MKFLNKKDKKLDKKTGFLKKMRIRIDSISVKTKLVLMEIVLASGVVVGLVTYFPDAFETRKHYEIDYEGAKYSETIYDLIEAILKDVPAKDVTKFVTKVDEIGFEVRENFSGSILWNSAKKEIMLYLQNNSNKEESQHYLYNIVDKLIRLNLYIFEKSQLITMPDTSLVNIVTANYVVLGDVLNTVVYIKKYQTSSVDQKESIQILKESLRDNINTFLLLYDFAINSDKENRHNLNLLNPKILKVRESVSKDNLDDMVKDILELSGDGFSTLKNSVRGNRDRVNSILNAIIFTLFFILSFSFWLMYLFIKSHISKLNTISKLTDRLETIQDIQKVDLKKDYANDEVGKIANRLGGLIERLSHLLHFKRQLEGDRELSTTYNRIHSFVYERFHFKDVEIFEVSNSNNKITRVIGTSETTCSKMIFGESELCRAKFTGKDVNFFWGIKPCQMHTGNSHHACLPMLFGGKIINIVKVEFDSEENNLELIRDDIRNLKEFLGDSSPIIEAKRHARTLIERAQKDHLTQLYNRKFIMSYLETLVPRIKQNNSKLGVIMGDVDHFKLINDTYGHQAGDEVLQSVANTMKKSVRDSDIVSRYGGEEFLILIPDTTETTLLHISEKIRVGIKKNKLRIGTEEIGVTISLGVSIFPDNSENIEEVIKQADYSLYQSKGNGRDRVTIFKIDKKEEMETNFREKS